MNILIFDWTLKGHHLEYLHHYYEGAILDKNNKYIFLVPSSFEDAMQKFVWEESNNIKFLYLSKEEEMKCIGRNLLVSAWHKSIIAKKYVRENAINKVWLIMIMFLMPFLPFLIPSKVKISGILYRIYLYDDTIKGIRLLLEKFRFYILARMKNIEKVYVLNDHFAQDSFNKLYNTTKFRYLPDPIPNIDTKNLKNLRNQLNIPLNNKIFLHFGGLNERKGTLEILRAIGLLNKADSSKMTFIFAGVIYDEIKDEFYKMKDLIKDKTQLIVFDEFCSYELINNLCFTCDVILTPYKNVTQSSGVVGYASLFKKPIVGTRDGLLGRIIEEYELGASISPANAENLKNTILKPILFREENNYVKYHSVKSFISILFQNLY